MAESSVQSTLLSDGYAAFNDDDWDTVKALFCADVPGADRPQFPLWISMEGEEYRGREEIFAFLRDLRAGKTKAKLIGVADHGNRSITLDITTGGAGPHACADEVEFDEAGLIKVFRHCAVGTHEHAHEEPSAT
jgi:hypothetical protein